MFRRIVQYLFLLPFLTYGQELVIREDLKILALGDSYTIGQSVLTKKRWPNQLADSLENKGYNVLDLKNIATTGWTTGNLLDAIDREELSDDFNLVGLLIGVNNQFQGRSLDEYEIEFEELLKKAIEHADFDKSKVFVLSIPDYHYTPFGEFYGSPDVSISDQIDLFNGVNKEITEYYEVTYIDITDISRRGLDEPELVASDGLHPSGEMYSLWVERILEAAVFEKADEPEPVLGLDARNYIPIFPNPTKDIIQLNQDVELPIEVKLFTLHGSQLFSATTLGGRIDIGHLPTGTYILEYRNSHETFRKLVIKE